MRKHLILTLLVAGVAGAATVTAPMVHPQTAAGRVIPVTVHNLDTGESTVVDRDDRTVLYDFNGSSQGWTSFGTGLPYDTWHVEPTGHGGTYTNTWWSADAAIGGYLNTSFVYLQTPAINLASAVSPTLTFALYYGCETPGGEPAGYNGWDGCNVWVSTDGGSNWAVISGTPAYNVSSSYAFGEEFGMGFNIPEWGGVASGWQNASFSLSSFVGQSDVRIRFVMCADPGVDFTDDPALIGMQVDNVVVSQTNLTTLWSDDGVTNVGGAPSHSFYVVPGTDAWTHTGSEFQCDNDPNLGCWIESPWIAYTPPLLVNLEQDLRVDLPDSDGNNDGFLEDYFYIEYTTNGNTWNTATYDYAGGTRPDWMNAYYHYTDADVFNGSLDFTLTSGSQIKLRYRIRTDGNDDGGLGTGLWVDNVNMITASVPLHDLSVKKAWFDYPRNVSVRHIPKVEVANLGATDENASRFAWKVFNDSTNVVVHAHSFGGPTTVGPFPPLSTIRWEQSVTAPGAWQWTPGATPAVYRCKFYPSIGSNNNADLNHANDTLTVRTTTTPANLGFLRYDYSTSTAWTLSQNAGEDGALVRFDPIANPWTVEFLFARVYNLVAGDEVHIVVHDQGVDNATPGALLGEYTTTITSAADVYPNYLIRYVGTIPYLRCINHPIWVGIRTNNHNPTGVVGLHTSNGGPYWSQHTYSYDYLASTATAWPGDVQLYLQVDWGIESEIPYDITLTGTKSGSNYTLNWNSPGPVDGYFVYRSADGYFTPGTPVATLPAGTTTWTDTIPVVGRYFYKVVGYNGLCPAN
jgi:hypothetical protein